MSERLFLVDQSTGTDDVSEQYRRLAGRMGHQGQGRTRLRFAGAIERLDGRREQKKNPPGERASSAVDTLCRVVSRCDYGHDARCSGKEIWPSHQSGDTSQQRLAEDGTPKGTGEPAEESGE